VLESETYGLDEQAVLARADLSELEAWAVSGSGGGLVYREGRTDDWADLQDVRAF